MACRIWDEKKKEYIYIYIYRLILLKEVGLGNLQNDGLGLNK